MNKLQQKSALFSVIFGFDAFVTDRIHKFYQIDIEGWTGGEFVPFLPFMDYTLVWNRGVSYGLLAGLPEAVVLVVVGMAFAALLLWWFRSKSFLTRTGLAIALGGALSNIADRWLYGAVADFFHLYIGQRSLFVFNLADAAITLGASLLVLEMLFFSKKRDS